MTSTGNEISVLIASYNMAQYISAAVDSCLNDLDSPEIVVVDDGSTDHTEDTLRPYVERGLIKYHRFPKNMGKNAAFNMAFELSTKSIITLLGADDAVLPGRQAAADTIAGLSGPRLVVGSYFYTDQDLARARHVRVRKTDWKTTLQGNRYPGGAMIFNRDLGSRVFPIAVELGNEDYLISLLSTWLGCDSVVDLDVLLYRRHSMNTWHAYDLIEAQKRGTIRHVAVLTAFKNSFLKTNNDKGAIDRAISARKAILNDNFLDRLSSISFKHLMEYDVLFILKIIFGYRSYSRLKVMYGSVINFTKVASRK